VGPEELKKKLEELKRATDRLQARTPCSQQVLRFMCIMVLAVSLFTCKLQSATCSVFASFK
jgi:hypothetical protein